MHAFLKKKFGLGCTHTAMDVIIVISRSGKGKEYFVPHKTKVSSMGSPCIKVKGTWYDCVAGMAGTHQAIV